VKRLEFLDDVDARRQYRFSLVKLGVLLALGWQALSIWERDHSWASLIGLLVLVACSPGLAVAGS
jgi:hypothetical protein